MTFFGLVFLWLLAVALGVQKQFWMCFWGYLIYLVVAWCMCIALVGGFYYMLIALFI